VISLPLTQTRGRLAPSPQRLPMQSALSGSPQTAKNWPSVKVRCVGDSTA